MGARGAGALAGLDYALLDALHPEGPYAPDFMAPPPRTPLPDVHEELERVRATPPERVRLELGWTFEGASRPRSRGRCSTTRRASSTASST